MHKNTNLTSGGGVKLFLAFTLVELIVVIVILAILGTISFISIQGYAKDARDTKRLSDINSIYGKISIETIKGISIQDFQKFTNTGEVTINGNPQAIAYYGTINFNKLNESEKSFSPPTQAKDDIYEYAYAIGENYRFLQLRAIKEVGGGYFTVGNYYKIKSNDFESLFDREELVVCESLGFGVFHIGENIYVSDGNECYTIADKNVGATKVADETICQYIGDPTCTKEYLGDSFQWGCNNPSGCTIDDYDTWGVPRGATWGAAWGADGGTNEEKQGPCPNGYHIPGREEWIGFINTWYRVSGVACSGTCDINLEEFQKDLKFPFSEVFNGERWGRYWLSEYYYDSMSSGGYSFINGEDGGEEALLYIYSSEYASSSLLVRCFKN